MQRRLFVPAVPTSLLRSAAGVAATSSFGDAQQQPGNLSGGDGGVTAPVSFAAAAALAQQSRSHFCFSRHRFCSAASASAPAAAATGAAETETKSAQKQSSDADATAATTTLKLPFYFHALADGDIADVRRIFHAMSSGYYDHIRFKKFGGEPHYKRDALEPVLEEAAEAVFRIRHALDLRAKIAAGAGGEAPAPVLRQLAGSSALYLHSEDAMRLWDKCGGGREGANLKEFTREVVRSTLRDAMGYVEKLTAADIDLFVNALHLHRFDPCVHAQSVLRELSERHNELLVARAELSEAQRQIEEGTELDKKWRAVIGKLYEANSCLSEITEEKK